MISLQTNVDSLVAQSNLNVDSSFQSKNIRELTSGYRINSSGDDAAGLAIANGYRDQITELNQGVNNAATGISQLQIVDGGLSNISTMLDRMKTLATESASTTLTGANSRTTLNNEYQTLLTEINRQATNIGLNLGGSNNTKMSVYIGGANSKSAAYTSNATVGVDLSGTTNAVDSASLGVAGTDVLGITANATGFAVSNTTRLDNPGTPFLAGGTQTFTVNYADSTGTTQSRSIVVNGGTNGTTGADVLSQLNAGLAGTGITASTAAADVTGIIKAGTLQFGGSGAFTVGVGAASAGTATVLAAAPQTAVNTAEYNVTSVAAANANTAISGADTFTLTSGTKSANINLLATDTLTTSVAKINSALQTAGITGVSALLSGDGTKLSIQGTANFSIVDTTAAAASSSPMFATLVAGNATITAATTTAGSAGTDAQAAIAAINNAIQQLGLTQGNVGAGENLLNYASSLATSQITNYSSAQSTIRDANVAADASNLTRSQTLQQTAIAAMAQANSEAQSVLKLLQ